MNCRVGIVSTSYGGWQIIFFKALSTKYLLGNYFFLNIFSEGVDFLRIIAIPLLLYVYLIFLRKLPITDLLSIKNQNKKI